MPSHWCKRWRCRKPWMPPGHSWLQGGVRCVCGSRNGDMETSHLQVTREQRHHSQRWHSEGPPGVAFLEIGNQTSEVLRFLFWQPIHALHKKICLQFLDQLPVISGLGITRLAMLRGLIVSLEKATDEKQPTLGVSSHRSIIHIWIAAPDPPGSCKQRLGQSEEGTPRRSCRTKSQLELSKNAKRNHVWVFWKACKVSNFHNLKIGLGGVAPRFECRKQYCRQTVSNREHKFVAKKLLHEADFMTFRLVEDGWVIETFEQM